MSMTHRVFSIVRRNSVAWVALLIGCLLGALAVPRVRVAFLALPAESAIFGIEQGANLTDDQLIRAEQKLKHAVTYGAETSSSNSQLSYLTIHRLTRNSLTMEDLEELQGARQQVKEAIQRKPLDAYLWTRYAHVSYLLEGLSAYTLAALQRSFQYGSDEMELLRFRMALCIREWDHLPPSLQQLTRDQIAYASAHIHIWASLLADTNEDSGRQLLVLLEEASVDTELVKQRTAQILRRTAAE